jgi:hypothetical protein
MQKNKRKIIQNPPGNKQKQCLTFSYWRFFSATYCTVVTEWRRCSSFGLGAAGSHNGGKAYFSKALDSKLCDFCIRIRIPPHYSKFCVIFLLTVALSFSPTFPLKKDICMCVLHFNHILPPLLGSNIHAVSAPPSHHGVSGLWGGFHGRGGGGVGSWTEWVHIVLWTTYPELFSLQNLS